MSLSQLVGRSCFCGAAFYGAANRNNELDDDDRDVHRDSEYCWLRFFEEFFPDLGVGRLPDRGIWCRGPRHSTKEEVYHPMEHSSHVCTSRLECDPLSSRSNGADEATFPGA